MLRRKLSRYLVRETFWLYLLGVAAFCLLLSIDLLTIWARWFVEYNAGLGDIGRHHALQTTDCFYTFPYPSPWCSQCCLLRVAWQKIRS